MTVLSWEDLLAGKAAKSIGDEGFSATIGVFDGVHRGHRELVGRVVEAGGRRSAVITFRQSPKAVFAPQHFPGYLYSLSQRLSCFDSLGVALVCLIDFSEDFGKLGGKDFISLIHDRLKLRYLAIGSNFRCGYGLDTDATRIASLNRASGIRTDIVPPVMRNGMPVSSSRIRTAMASGDLVEVRALLGRDIELDLDGAPTTPGPAWVDYYVGAIRRLTPPPGRYAVTYLGEGLSPVRGFVDIQASCVRAYQKGAERIRFDPLLPGTDVFE